MKHLLLAAFFPLLLAGCNKKAEPAPDPFLGHWQTELDTYFVVDAAGTVVDPGATITSIGSLDVTPTFLQLTVGTGPTASTSNAFGYTREGELLHYAGVPLSSPQHYYARSLSATSFEVV